MSESRDKAGKPLPKGRKARREAVRERLLARDLDGLAAWARRGERLVTTLFSLLLDADELVRWRAIEGFGRVASVLAEEDPERVREILRRILWAMNDESGGLLRHGPEAVAEILVRVPALIPEYAPLLPSFLTEEPFERGAHWAVARVASVATTSFRKRTGELEGSLKDPDPAIRFHAALALLRIAGEDAVDEIAELRADPSTFRVYDLRSGTFLTQTIGDGLAKEGA
ncbi:MAG: DVU0298 family protein [Planctomycetota bacterium]|jgi:hypothetical protein